jgi:hypothetical protein
MSATSSIFERRTVCHYTLELIFIHTRKTVEWCDTPTGAPKTFDLVFRKLNGIAAEYNRFSTISGKMANKDLNHYPSILFKEKIALSSYFGERPLEWDNGADRRLCLCDQACGRLLCANICLCLGLSCIIFFRLYLFVHMNAVRSNDDNN